MIEVILPIGVLVILLLGLSLITRLISTAILNRTIREALRSHPESVPVLAARLDGGLPWAHSLSGWIMIALSATLIVFALLENPADRLEMLKISVVPSVLGITTLLYLRLARNDRRANCQS